MDLHLLKIPLGGGMRNKTKKHSVNDDLLSSNYNLIK